jgi:hypothetical protein
MRRSIVVAWHAVSFVLAGGLYFLSVLPRWPEFAGHVSPATGTTLRIVTGALLALTALPVLLNLRRSRRPEFGTPQLALGLRTWSIVAHVLAGVVIIAAAITEWRLGLGKAGVWLFGVYGAAATLAVLGLIAFYTALAAESAPRPPKPLKSKKERIGHKSGKEMPGQPDDGPTAAEIEDIEDIAEVGAKTPVEAAPDHTDNAGEISDVSEPEESIDGEGSSEDDDAVLAAPRRGLLNRRPTARGRRGGVALSD